jgi:hypothetical protein
VFDPILCDLIVFFALSNLSLEALIISLWLFMTSRIFGLSLHQWTQKSCD